MKARATAPRAPGPPVLGRFPLPVRILGYTAVAALGLLYLMPFVIQLVTGFKTDPDAAARPLGLIPTTCAARQDFRDPPPCPPGAGPVIAKALGYHDRTATRLVTEAGGTWSRYAPATTGGDAGGPTSPRNTRHLNMRAHQSQGRSHTPSPHDGSRARSVGVGARGRRPRVLPTPPRPSPGRLRSGS